MDQTFVFITIGLALAMFVWGRFRHDLVSLGALLLLVILGVVPSDEAFSGFANPAAWGIVRDISERTQTEERMRTLMQMVDFEEEAPGQHFRRIRLENYRSHEVTEIPLHSAITECRGISVTSCDR